MKTNSVEIDFSIHRPEPCAKFYEAKRILGSSFEGLTIAYSESSVGGEYGVWIDMRCRDSKVYRGIAFIDGELYELDEYAHFYRDVDPLWSPVVHAETEAVQKAYKAIVGKTYPVFKPCPYGGVEHQRLVWLKQEKGFVYTQGSFIHPSSFSKYGISASSGDIKLVADPLASSAWW